MKLSVDFDLGEDLIEHFKAKESVVSPNDFQTFFNVAFSLFEKN